MNKLIILIFKLFFLFIQFLSIKSELKLVAEFFRHGARQVIYDYWNAEIFPDWGELTSVGMRQHFVLGQTLRQRYIEDLKFLSPYYNSSEMYLQSTDVNRTLRSAISQLYGFYPVEFGPYLPIDIPEDLLQPPWSGQSQNLSSAEALPKAYQPFPLHTQLSEYDYVLKAYSSHTCPINAKLQQEQRESSDYKNLLSVVEGSLLKVAGMINWSTQSVNFYQGQAMMDVFQDDIFWNKPIPEGIVEDTKVWKDLNFAYNLYMFIEMYATETQKKLVATPVFDELISIFNQSLTNSSPIKWRMYSAHDTTIGMIVAALNLTDYQCMYDIYQYGYTNASQCIYDYPSFATSLIVELYEETNSSKYVKVLYNGEYQNLCGQKSTSCEYNTFVMRMENYKLSHQDFLNLCHQEADDGLLFCVVCYFFFLESKKNVEKEENLQKESDNSQIYKEQLNSINMLVEKKVEEKQNQQLISLQVQCIVSVGLMGLIIFLIYLNVSEKRKKIQRKFFENSLQFQMNQVNIS